MRATFIVIGLILLLSPIATADEIEGAWVINAPAGPVVLQIDRGDAGKVAGTLTGSGTTLLAWPSTALRTASARTGTSTSPCTRRTKPAIRCTPRDRHYFSSARRRQSPTPVRELPEPGRWQSTGSTWAKSR